jgi:hypothetical protein
MTRALLAVAVALAASSSAPADTVEMRDGTLVQGAYVGGTAGTIRVQTTDGNVKVISTAEVLALTFASGSAATTAPTAAGAAAAQPAAAAAPPATPQPVMVPAGSVLTVKLDGPVSSKDPEGKKFTAKLVGDLTADGKTVAKAGSTVYGQVDKSKQAGRLAGKSELKFSLSGIDMNGKIQPIVTTNYSETGKGEFRKTARNTAVGGLVGNAIDDDGGAGKGAAVGAGVSLIKKGDAVTAPAGMLLEFRLSQPFQATVTP